MTDSRLALYLAQVNPLVGDIDSNTDLVLGVVEKAKAAQATLVVFPELVLTGYPPEDLLLRPSIGHRIARSLERVRAATQGICVVLGYPASAPKGKLFNAAGVFENGKKIAEYHKRHLPNYQVFDELRYFVPGESAVVFSHRGVPVALNICEDIWFSQPASEAADAGAKVIINLNASPFDIYKHENREKEVALRSRECSLPIVYLNQVGGQDELVFDGASLIVDQGGNKIFQAPMFDSWQGRVDLIQEEGNSWCLQQADSSYQPITPRLEADEMVYKALVNGVRDYTNKNGFKGVVLGLSGGIDSALTLAIAVDALGPDRVEAIMMPFRYTSDLSRDLASDQACRQGVTYRSISIEPMYEAFMQALTEEFENLPVDATEQNIQARCRGIIQMAVSNKKGLLVLTTGNKSEMAVGYATLYGDMAGGFDALKDVPKTLVYQLARYRNRIEEVIPIDVIERAPSAELAPDQKDSDSLPDYDVLDAILLRYIERDESAEQIVAQGYNREDVTRVIRLVDLNEYKRRQAAVGVRISSRGFGRDRRYPITNGWKMGD